MNPVYAFLNNFRTEDDATHQVYGPKFYGKFKLDDNQRKQFMKLYQTEIENQTELNILERPQEYGPILIDIDINVYLLLAFGIS